MDIFHSNFKKLLSWNVATQGAGLLATLALGYVFTPDQIGYLSAFLAVCYILTSFVSLKIEWYIPNTQNEKMISRLLFFACLSAIVLTLVSVGLMPVVVAMLKDLHISSFTLDRYIQFFITLCVLIFVLESIASSLLVQKGKVYRLGMPKFLRHLLSLAFIFLITLIATPPTTHTLILIFTLSYGISVLIILSRSDFVFSLKSIEFRNLFKEIKPNKAFRRYMGSVCVSLVNVSSSQIIPILLVVFYGPAHAGFYFIAQKMIIAPTTLITTAISVSFWSYTSNMIQTNPNDVYKNYIQMTKRMALAGIPLIAIAFILSLIFPHLFNNDWAKASSVMLCILPMALGTLIFGSLGHLIVLNKHHYQICADATRFIGTILILYLSNRYDLSFPIALFLVAILSFLSHCLFFLMHKKAYKILLRQGEHT